MELQFTKEGEQYVAQFTATGDFNLHIEKSRGRVYMLQSTVENGRYDGVKGASWGKLEGTIDSDFTSLVYPKYIRIESEVEPTMAVVTFTSDVQEAIDASIVSNLNTPV